ncbi:MAG: M28 family peptidase [Gemmatimonadales bacterium]
MHFLFLFALLAALSPTHLASQTPAAAVPASSVAARVAADLHWLADDARAGRLTGSPEADSAAAWIARQFQAAGVQPAGVNGWFQSFAVAADAPSVAGTGLGGRTGLNVLGLIPGTDPDRRDEVLIVGAHYDHLGTGEVSSLSPELRGQVHNGADDNASGTAALLEIARQLAARPPARSVLLIAFSGEELGLLGSSHYVRQPVIPIARTVAMLNLDMVGRLREGRLLALGAATATEFPAILDSLNATAGFDLRASGDGYGRSDHASFYIAKVPVIHFFTDLHEDYHRASDDAATINTDGLAQVATFTARLARTLADRTHPLTFVDLPPPPPPAVGAVTSGYGAYLGSIPDMSGGVTGVRISGTRTGSPADLGGMRAGDIIRRIGSFPVDDLQGMTDALRAHRPGDRVAIEVERDGRRLTLQITLGTRSE